MNVVGITRGKETEDHKRKRLNDKKAKQHCEEMSFFYNDDFMMMMLWIKPCSYVTLYSNTEN